MVTMLQNYLPLNEEQFVVNELQLVLDLTGFYLMFKDSYTQLQLIFCLHEMIKNQSNNSLRYDLFLNI